MSAPAQLDGAPRQRLTHVDAAWAYELLEYLRQDLADRTAEAEAGRVRSVHIHAVTLAERCKDLALLHYALGSDLNVVHDYLALALRHYFELFAAPGAPPSLRVTTVAVPGPFDHDHDGPSGQLRGPDQPDYSLTNPCRGLLALQLALIVGEQVEPREIAGLIHDPPDADFLAPGSADSAPAQRHLARAFKALVLQDSTQAAAELDALAHSGDLPSAEASALRALLQRNVADFLRALGDLMSRHAKEAIKAHNGKVPDFYLSFAGLGLAALALRTGAVTQSLLPCDNVYLPLELLDMRRNGGTAGART